ncbi:hypothetical protein [Candidatus Entotheonella palauensis]|uniref:hypothetical protein n=1 Tax=Candidatus Entotheonella palauensis TaxID=93172 RepID=UPI00117745CA|nr:hypothetical protein [Candidatus Entotheonella palauensis]
MGTSNETAKLTCPCCQATLVVDRDTMTILYADEHREKAGGTSFNQALEDLKAKEQKKSNLFQQAMAEEKQRRESLGKKFDQLQKKAAEEPDAPLPPRPFELD